MDQQENSIVRRSERLLAKKNEPRSVPTRENNPVTCIHEETTSRPASLHSARGSTSTHSSAASRHRLAEVRAARELAELEQRRLGIEIQRVEHERMLENKQIECERAAIQARLEETKAQIDVEAEEDLSIRTIHSRTSDWVRQRNTELRLQHKDITCGPTDREVQYRCHQAGGEQRHLREDHRDDDVANLAHALTDAIKQATTSLHHSVSPVPPSGDKLLGRLSAKDLPVFSGDPLDWLRFKHAFETTTKIGQYDAKENVARLQRCLRGEAWEAVAARVITVASADDIIKTLEMRFGRPELVLHKIMGEIRKLPKLSGSRSDLVNLATKVSNCVAAITATNRVEYLDNPDLVNEIVSKLTENLVYRWSDYIIGQNATQRPRLAALSDYLMRDAEQVCRAGVMEVPPKMRTSNTFRQSVLATVGEEEDDGSVSADEQINNGSVNAIASPNKISCPYCGKTDHGLDSCPGYAAQDVDAKWEWVVDKRLCFKCFSPYHRRVRCRSKKQCKSCKRGHHTLLHRDYLQILSKGEDGPKEKSDGDAGASGTNKSDDAGASETTANVWSGLQQSKRVYLKVLPVVIEGPTGSFRTHALLDEGSSVTLVDSSVAEKIGAHGTTASLNLQGAVGDKVNLNSSIVSFTLRTSEGSFLLQRVRTVDKLNLPSQTLNKEMLNKFPHLQDVPIQSYAGSPMLLIGQDYWQLIVSREIKQGRMNEPVASRTSLGWVLHGFVSSICHDTVEYNYHVHRSEADVELHELVKNYFRVDDLGVRRNDAVRHTPEEKRALLILDTGSKRIGEGKDRWEAGLLWRSEEIKLPDNKREALKRLAVVEKMMDRDPDFATDYSKQVQTLLDRDYAEKVVGPVTGDRVWYLPHFGVRNPNKPGKLRLVHDARSETKGISLNTELLSGPDLLNSLLGVLLRFRERAVAVSGDIREMFMRVKINKEDQNSQLFLWRGMNRDKPPDTYRMTSMIFGAKSSPCTATYIIRRNADEFVGTYPRAVMAIKQRHYVDDYLDSVDTVEEMKHIVENVISIHLAGGFEIRGFVSNKPECLFQHSDSMTSVNICQSDGSQRTLGMVWKPGFDLSFKKIDATIANGTRKPTKREMLRLVMSIFDPLGFLSPFIIRGKILLQHLWRSGVGWDEMIGDAFAKTWFDWLRDLKLLREFSVPRCYGFSSINEFQLHVFVDASEQAYAAVAYLRRENGEVAFIAAKCRVAPLKSITVPRLELQAALMGARLGATIVKEHDLPIKKKIFWTDSRVVWCWIQNNPTDKRSCVSNRLNEIEELSSRNEWKWIPGELNVADEATRAKHHTDMATIKWIKGPDFLSLPEDNWPSIRPIPNEDEPEQKVTLATHVLTDFPLPDIAHFSKWLRLIRVTAMVVLFVERLKCKTKVTLEPRHLNRAEELWTMQSQKESFADEISKLVGKIPIPKRSRLKNLSVFMDDGVLRLYGRARSVHDVDSRMLNPVVLDGRNRYSRLLIRHFHEKAFHGNTEYVVNELRQKYWVLHLRSAVKSIEYNCLFCRIRKRLPLEPPTGDLPLARLAHHKRPFTHCGLDYFGPMTVTIGRRREKRYGALFTCMTTRAIHLELAGSLTTDSAIMALRRMMCRRGCPDVIYSDNGTNFHGAHTELKKVISELDQHAMSNFMTNRRIEWRFNPPLAPHMGGVWERLVRSVKTSLKVVLREQTPKEETLLTLMAEVEHTINSRPLTHVSSSPSDPEALTPNHFLIGGASNVPWLGPCEMVTRKCWRDAQRLADLFWKRWMREYLPTLLPRSTQGRISDIRVGSVVLVADPSMPRNIWPRGEVVQLFPGRDGVSRVANVRTLGGVLKRPLNRLIQI